ncbi:hypothetical protein [Allofournierella massiliensis]|uniref:hypothetical protein n=1 Tax=Allofournierella massiliensis TaxID=1650663 RepID=UPI0025A4ACBB|nr:hypothetical protein [Fournierella massiliensis]
MAVPSFGSSLNRPDLAGANPSRKKSIILRFLFIIAHILRCAKPSCSLQNSKKKYKSAKAAKQKKAPIVWLGFVHIDQ